ncbi:MAG TPA: prolyl oligopeptidase family serine peptidase [Gemmatimonadaceae bacterium]|nr:prolyl oligopeptidase family serine peptidase [Gemmatimonadaceae bacterium]
MRSSLLPALLLAAASAAAQQPAPDTFPFDIPSIMRGPEIVGRPPQRVRWSADGQWLYFSWAEPGTDWREPDRPFRVRPVAGAKPERLTIAQMDSAGPLIAHGALSPDRRWRAVESNGDIYLVDQRTFKVRRLTATLARESDPSWDVTGRLVFFVRDGNAFSIDLTDGTERQLTDIRPGPEPKEPEPAKGQRGALEAQQRALLQAVRDKLRADSMQKADRKEREALWPRTVWLDKDERVASISVSPSGRAAIVVTTIPAGDKAKGTIVPNWVTSSGYVEDIKGREKVGDAQDGARVALVAIPSGAAKWLRVIPGDSTHAPAMVRVAGWNDAGTQALVVAVPADWKARWLETVSADSGALHTADVLRDTCWVDGPSFGEAGWTEGGKRIWFASEADGWAHLYSVAPDGSGRTQLTSGKWEVFSVSVSDDGKWFWLVTSERSPFEHQFYRMPVGGGAREMITTAVGEHDVEVSPDGKSFADVYSYSNKPPELYVSKLAPGAGAVQLTTSPTAEWRSHQWIAPEIVWIPASDGQRIAARVYRPKDLGAQPNGAAVIFVHGAGYLHNVHNWWSSYFREYMFNQLLAKKGYTVVDADYRGSAGYGRDWRVGIWHHMGGRDLQDEVDVSKWLEATYGIPPTRVGMYGGSYGGFMTLMAMFTEPKRFGAGAALRSVTDWAHYNHWYTVRILGLPEVDSVAYRISSPIYFADGLQGPLLIEHGLVDTNVEVQDDVRLVERLIELGKTNWEFAVYPVENHGFVRPSSWTDEYRRIMGLFDGTIGKR